MIQAYMDRVSKSAQRIQAHASVCACVCVVTALMREHLQVQVYTVCVSPYVCVCACVYVRRRVPTVIPTLMTSSHMRIAFR